mmetsp:Transcript_2059/g.2504  ORF Transcript_2059/g.2504 Transcript_2059/m.2504 type:complete len:634 (-) Transcript_2059:61-1962(-)
MAFVFSACGADALINCALLSGNNNNGSDDTITNNNTNKPLALIPTNTNIPSTKKRNTMSSTKEPFDKVPAISPARSGTTATTATMTDTGSSTASTASFSIVQAAAALKAATSNTKRMTFENDDPMRCGVEIMKDRLYYAVYKDGQPPTTNRRNTASLMDPSVWLVRNGKPIYFFSIDYELLYWNFFLDFGPLNLGQLFRFSKKLNTILEKKPNHIICFYSSGDYAKRANAVYLICAWQCLYLKRTPEEALRGFRLTEEKNLHHRKQHNEYYSSRKNNNNTRAGYSSFGAPSHDDDNDDVVKKEDNKSGSNASKPPKVGMNSLSIYPPLKPFHDASPCMCTYDLTVIDCLNGLIKASMYGFFDYMTFNVQEYEHFEQVENGDLNWIIKDRILAFAGPHFRRNVSREGYCALTPDDYIPYFQDRNVSLVIRLNKKCYEETDFTNAGIRHYDQYYLDGSCPPSSILRNVLSEMESCNGAFAVHCKAGLGRTGTCIGAYLMKHYKFSAAEAIGWMRICRPGMVIGPQQHFLQEHEQQLWQEGMTHNSSPTISIMDTPVSCTRTTLGRNDSDNNNNRTVTSSTTKITMVDNSSNSPMSVIVPQYVVTTTTKTSIDNNNDEEDPSGQAAQLLRQKRYQR